MIRKIVITGGPCAGKTTGMSWIQKAFEAMGYLLLFLTEPAVLENIPGCHREEIEQVYLRSAPEEEIRIPKSA